MRVLLFRSLCDTGGVSSWMQEHARELMRSGVEPHFWFCRESARLPEFFRLAPTTLGSMARLVAHLEAQPFDVVHVSSTDGSAELLSVLRPQPKLIATNRGALTRDWNRHDCFARTAVSGDMARMDQPFSDLLVEPIPNGVDGTRFTPPSQPGSGPPIVAWIGRTTDLVNKDFPRFTRIVSRLPAGRVRVWVADAHGADWSKFSCPPCARVDVERWERVAHTDMPAFYRAVAASGGVVVMTSPAEGFGWAAVEAAACGAATIAPDVVGLRETVLDGITGRLFPLGMSDDAVAQVVSEWLARGANAASDMAQRAEAIRERFSLTRMTSRYLEVYRRSEQRPAPDPRPRHDPDDPALPGMLAVMERLRRNRALATLNGVQELLDAGRGDVAGRALRQMWRRMPGQFVRGDTWRRSAKLALRLMRRAGKS